MVYAYKRVVMQGRDMDSVNDKVQTKTWHRVVGGIWDFLFTSWSSPSYMYPMMKRTREGLDDWILPWRVNDWLRDVLRMDN